MKEERIICVGCPLGCEVKLTLNDNNEVTGVDYNKCKEGEKYAVEEFKNPVPEGKRFGEPHGGNPQPLDEINGVC